MSLAKGEKGLMKFNYDFAVDGGSTGLYTLRQAAGNALKAGDLVTDLFLRINDSITGGTSAAFTIGNNDVDGYFADFFFSGVISAAGSCIRVGEVAGALVWDDSNDHKIAYAIPAAANAPVTMTIGTAALTAGSFDLYVEVIG